MDNKFKNGVIVVLLLVAAYLYYLNDRSFNRVTEQRDSSEGIIEEIKSIADDAQFGYSDPEDAIYEIYKIIRDWERGR